MMEWTMAKDEFGQGGKPSRAMAYALDMVTAFGDAGLTIVPVKPTLEMLTAGAQAGDISIETVWRIYQAMISAAEQV